MRQHHSKTVVPVPVIRIIPVPVRAAEIVRCIVVRAAAQRASVFQLSPYSKIDFMLIFQLIV